MLLPIRWSKMVRAWPKQQLSSGQSISLFVASAFLHAPVTLCVLLREGIGWTSAGWPTFSAPDPEGVSASICVCILLKVFLLLILTVASVPPAIQKWSPDSRSSGSRSHVATHHSAVCRRGVSVPAGDWATRQEPALRRSALKSPCKATAHCFVPLQP